VAACVLLAGCSGGSAPTGAAAHGAPSDWQRYVLGPPGPDVAPVAVARTSGDVTGARSLLGAGGTGSTTLTLRPGGTPPVLVLDFGKDVGGVPWLDIRSSTGSPQVRTAFSEGLDYLGPGLPRIGPTGDDAGPDTASASAVRFELLTATAPGRLGTGQIQGGERYELITLTSPGSVTIARAWIHFTPYRAGAGSYRGWFLSSSDTLDREWFSGAYTAQLDQIPVASVGVGLPPGTDNTLPLVLDGAKRDRAVWAGDLDVSGPAVLYSTAATAYVRSSLELLASYQVASGEMAGSVSPVAPLGTYPATADYPTTGAPYSAAYSMDVVRDIADYVRFTGDLAFARAEWPAISRELAWNRSGVDARGLLVTTADDGQDWDYYDGTRSGAVTATNALYVGTLRAAAALAGALGDGAAAAADGAQADQVAGAMNRFLWDPALGAYPVSDTLPGTVAQDGNSLAVLYGIAPPADVPTILATLRRTLWTTPYGPVPFSANTGYRTDVSPFASDLEVQARFVAGDTTGAMQLLTALWGHMLAPGPDETGTFWEVLGADGTPGLGSLTSLAHGWAGGPTPELSHYVLGIAPVADGFATWTVDPHPGRLRWAEGQVGTPHGAFHVRWDAGGDGALALTVAAPAGTHGVVQVPVPSATARVTVGGRPVSGTPETTPAGQATVLVPVDGGGSVRVVVTPSGR
jgi:hypothetical protein